MKLIQHLLAAAAALAITTGAHAAPSLTLAPASIGALPGLSSGWGFSLLNDSDNYLLVTGTAFNPAPQSAFGSYIGWLDAAFTVLAPHETLAQAYDHAAGTGLGEFTLAGSAAGELAGTLELDYALFSADPSSAAFNPDLDTVAFDLALTADAKVSVLAGQLPEPASLALVTLGGMAAALVRRRAASRGGQTA